MFDHFGFLAPFYEFFIKPKPPHMLEEFTQLPSSGRLLDVGGGTGRISQYFSGGDAQIIVSDLSYKMLRQTESKGGLQPVCSHSEALPFQNAYFDRVIMVDALHHVCDQQKTADEIWRVLAPGGRVIIEEPNVHRRVVKLVALGEKLALMRSHFLTPEEIKGLFPADGSSRTVYEEDHTAWVIIHKNGS